MAIHAEDYNEACALCDCLDRHLTNFVYTFLQPGDIVIDGGGNIGEFSLLAACKVGRSGKVLVYEPNHVVASRLELSCDLNHYAWMSIRPVALGSRSGAVAFYVANNSQLSSLFELDHRLGPHREVRCEMVRLGDELSRFGLEREPVALVKLDLEGGELDALQGMMTLLKAKAPPAFMVELNVLCRPDGKEAVRQIIEMFRGLGYQDFSIKRARVYRGDEPPSLIPLRGLPEVLADALFIHPKSRVYARLSRYLH